jgi:hypothetical protein
MVDIKESVNLVDFFQTWIFPGFSLKRGAAKLRRAGGGRVRPVIDVNGTKKTGARSARALLAAKNTSAFRFFV